MSKWGPKVLALRAEGKSYKQIVKILGCGISVVCYHLGKGQKEKNAKRRRKRQSLFHPYQKKIEHFIYERHNPKTTIINNNLSLYKRLNSKVQRFFCDRKGNKMKPLFNVQDVLDKFGENPKCYITGEQLDINKTRTYQFDHIIPRSRGGSNNLDNLGLCTKQANQAKHNMTPDELIDFCKTVLKHHNYTITKTD